MKRYSIALILAVFAVIIVTLTACGNKKGTDNEPGTEPVSTVVGDDGRIYEEVTEIHTEIVTENVEVTKANGEKETETVINTVPVTKKGGEKVTKKGGEVETQTQIETQVVTEVRTEVRTEVVTQTVPYTTTEPDASTEAPSTTSVDDVTYAAGTPVQVDLNKEGNPEEPLVNQVFEAVKQKKQLALSCKIVTNEDTGMPTGEIPNKIYIKGENMAYEIKIGAMTVKIVSKDGNTAIIFPGAKAYYSATGDSAASDIKELDIWDTFTNEGMEYVGTTRVNSLTCEEYKSGEASMKYYFDNSNNLKRIEINDGGAITIMKIDTIRTTVSDSEFEIPKGYTKLSEEKFESLLGTLGTN